jgi:hypothetical protein
MIAAADEPFAAAVLAVTADVLDSGRRIDVAADDHLGRCVSADIDAIPRADLLICAAACVHMVTESREPDRPPVVDFAEFADTCRVVAMVVSPNGPTLIQRTLQYLNATWKAYRQIDEGLRHGGRRP